MLWFVRVLARLARSFPVVVIVVVIVLTAVFGALAGQQTMDQSPEAFAPDIEELDALEVAGEEFTGSTDTVVQILVAGSDVVSPEGLQTVTAVQAAVMQALPPEQLASGGPAGPVLSYLAPAQMALAGVDPSGGEAPADGGEAAPPALGDLTDDQVDDAFRAGLGQLPPEFSGQIEQLVAADGAAIEDADLALMLVFLDTDAIVGDLDDMEASEALFEAVRSVADAAAAAGPLEVSAFSQQLLFAPDDSFNQEIGRLFGIAALVIVLILFVVYLVTPRGATTRLAALRRAAADTGLTLFTILASITWMQGIGVLLGPDYLGFIGAFSPPTQIIPILLIGLGVDYAIHLTSRYREEVGEGAGVDDGMSRAVHTVGIALVLATITTALGFLTNITNPIPSIFDFGVLAAVGILSAFLLMLTFVPSVRGLLDRRAERAGRLPREALGTQSENRLSGVMARASILAERAPAAVLAATLAFGVLGAYGLTQLKTEFSFVDFVPDDSPLRASFETIQERFGGGFGEQTQVIIQGDVATPDVHNATLAALANLNDTEGVLSFGEQAAAQSVPSVLGMIAAAANPETQPQAAPGGQEPEVSPERAAEFLEMARANGLQDDLTFSADGDVAAVYQVLLDAVPTAGSYLSADMDTSQVVVSTRSSEVGAIEVQTAIADDFAPVAQATDDVTVTSFDIVGAVIVDALSSSQVSSLAITLVAALLLLMVTFGVRERRPELGAITIIPVALVVLWVFGMMAATGIPFGPVTAMISALAIGIGVPFTIHITHRFTEDLERYGDIEQSLKSTMRHTGGALAGSAFTTMAGFLVLTTSSLTPFRQLGLVVAYAIGFSLLAAVVVLPSMLALWARWRNGRGEPREAAPAAVETHG